MSMTCLHLYISIYSKSILFTDSKHENISLTPGIIYRTKTGNNVSKFTYLNWIT